MAHAPLLPKERPRDYNNTVKQNWPLNRIYVRGRMYQVNVHIYLSACLRHSNKESAQHVRQAVPTMIMQNLSQFHLDS
jgi:hypothetical protein